jgi:hypothetical protein
MSEESRVTDRAGEREEARRYIREVMAPILLRIGLISLIVALVCTALEVGWPSPVEWTSLGAVVVLGAGVGWIEAIARASRVRREPEVYVEAFRQTQALRGLPATAVWERWRRHPRSYGTVAPRFSAVVAHVLVGVGLLALVVGLPSLWPGALMPPATIFASVGAFYLAAAFGTRLVDGSGRTRYFLWAYAAVLLISSLGLGPVGDDLTASKIWRGLGRVQAPNARTIFLA